MAFQETRLDNHITSLFQLPDFNYYTQCRNTEGGGVALYVSKVYNSSLLPDLCYMEADIECVAVELKLSQGLYICASIYRSPKGNVLNFLVKFNNILKYISDKSYKGMFFLGDWNIDLLRQNSNPAVSNFIRMMHSYSCFPLITKPTRATCNSTTLIDNIWSTEIECNIRNMILYTDISDHFPIVSTFTNHRERNFSKQTIHKRTFPSTSIRKFVELIRETNWNNIYTCSCASKGFELFEAKFREIFEKIFPIKAFCSRNKDKICPYITSALKKSITERKRLERLSIKWPLSYREKYKTYRNKLTNLLRIARINYHKEALRESQGNAKDTWQIINTILGSPPFAKNQGPIDIECNNISVPDAFNNIFFAIK